MSKKPKSLVKSMTYAEIENYVDNHPEYEIPDVDTAQSWELYDLEHDSFWIRDTLGGYRVIYNKRKQMFYISHPNIKHKVVLRRRNA